jgi:hypothetical protein
MSRRRLCTSIVSYVVLCCGPWGCCLKSITTKPTLNAVELSAAKIGSASFETTFEFKSCCPSADQKKLALDIQRAMTDLFQKLIHDEITLASYNEKVQAANDALSKVVLVCNAGPGGPGADIGVKGGTRAEQLQDAWHQAREALAALQAVH